MTIDCLKATACILVVFQHALSFVVNRRSGDFSWIVELYYYTSQINVPLFFLISGYLLHQQPVRQYIRKKAVGILTPFVFFSGLKLLYSLFVSSEFAHGGSVVSQIYLAFIEGELYWFSYAIFIMFLLAPLFWKTTRITYRGTDYDLPLTAMICFLLLAGFNVFNIEYEQVILPNIFQISLTVEFMPFFLMGYMLRTLYPLVSRKSNGIVIVLVILSLPGVYLLRNLHSFMYLRELGMPLFLCLDTWFIFRSVKKLPGAIHVISGYTYQVFFLDSFVKIVLFSIIEKLSGTGIYLSSAGCIAVAVLETIVNVGLSCIVLQIVQRIPVISLLFGFSSTNFRIRRKR